MSDFSSIPGPAAASAATDYRVLTELGTYAEAQRLVDRLSDQGFPVENVRVVGTGIHTVEQVTGRRTNGRAAATGAASGAWFGLLVGLLLSLFVVGPGWLTMVLTAVVLGAVFGAFSGFLAHWTTRGTRDFSSVQGLEASRYEVQVAAAFLPEAARLANP